MNPEEILDICDGKLQEAENLLNLEAWNDGTHPQSVHRVNMAKAQALIAIGLALKVIAERGHHDQTG